MFEGIFLVQMIDSFQTVMISRAAQNKQEVLDIVSQFEVTPTRSICIKWWNVSTRDEADSIYRSSEGHNA